MNMPPLHTARLLIRPFTMDDLDDAYQILDVDLAEADTGAQKKTMRDERRRWLQWTTLGYEELTRLYQPPYGDRAIALADTGRLIGACGLTPLLDLYDRLPGLRGAGDGAGSGHASTECGLFWAVAPSHQRRGYATEAARALVDYAFTGLNLRRILATTTYDNEASMAVMRKVGMRIERNPYPDPPWLQVVGALDHPEADPDPTRPVE